MNKNKFFKLFFISSFYSFYLKFFDWLFVNDVFLIESFLFIFNLYDNTETVTNNNYHNVYNDIDIFIIFITIFIIILYLSFTDFVVHL